MKRIEESSWCLHVTKVSHYRREGLVQRGKEEPPLQRGVERYEGWLRDLSTPLWLRTRRETIPVGQTPGYLPGFCPAEASDPAEGDHQRISRADGGLGGNDPGHRLGLPGVRGRTVPSCKSYTAWGCKACTAQGGQPAIAWGRQPTIAQGGLHIIARGCLHITTRGCLLITTRGCLHITARGCLLISARVSVLF
ncbi:UNVERIFIED_CONTAM: hypothetical protein FKN15_040427 [Acipenser sinensis]